MRRVCLSLCGAAVLAGLHCGKANDQGLPADLSTVRPEAQLALRPIPTENPGVDFHGFGHGLSARFAEGARVNASVVLPARAHEAFVVRSEEGTKTEISVFAVGAAPVPARVERGLVKYAGIFGPGTEAMHRVSPGGTEDYVTFQHAPERSELSYRVTLGELVAGLRQIGDSLEFMDADGSPRLRIDTPYGIDAKSERFAAHVSVSDCAVDRDPAAPWGRPVVKPGRESCLVQVRWDANANLSYPVVIDPAWTAAGNLGASNVLYEMHLAKNTGGKPLAVVAPGNVAQIYDTVAGTWANTGAPTFTFAHRTRLIAISGNKSFGIDNAGNTSVYDAMLGTWAPGASPPGGIDGNGVAAYDIGGGHVLVFDSSGRAYNYDVAAKTYATKTPAGRFIGGNLGVFKASATKLAFMGASTTKVALYDVVGDAWTFPTSDVLDASAVNCGNLELLTNGKLLAYGACNSVNQASVFDIVGDTVAPVAMANTFNFGCLCGHTVSVAYGKQHLIAGGRFTYDEATGLATDNGAFPSTARGHGAIVRLDDGRTLGAGGSIANAAGGDYSNNLTDVYGPSASADCGGSPFGTVATPVYDSVTSTCKACDGDNGGATTFKCQGATAPACQKGVANPLLGRCTQCSATNQALCIGMKPTCDTTLGSCVACNGSNGVAAATHACPTTAAPVCKVDGSCVLANGDNGTAATQPCPTAANPYLKSDGSCGKCTASTGCVGAAHAGPICNVTAGSCGTVCAADTDCPGKYCDLTALPKACTPLKAGGATCAGGNQCASTACTNGKCDTACTVKADCPAGNYCDTIATPRLCKVQLDDGAACTTGDQCKNGSCTSGTCAAPPPPDAGTLPDASTTPGAGPQTGAPDAGSTDTSGGDSGGCAMIASRPTGAGLGGLAVLGFVGLALRRIRRRAA